MVWRHLQYRPTLVWLNFVLGNESRADGVVSLWRNVKWQGAGACRGGRSCLAERAGEGFEVAHPNQWPIGELLASGRRTFRRPTGSLFRPSPNIHPRPNLENSIHPQSRSEGPAAGAIALR
jgi:hypothetical protein